ncbi:MAG: RHS repeat-associated core domain-containing protein, partial [Bryobacteraceae bacterium]
GYDPSNQRVYSKITNFGATTETFYFYGADGKKLGAWTLQPFSSTITLASLNTWFGGRLLKPQDRLNSIGKYFPYGEDRYSPHPANPTNGKEKFATYTRDAETGLDYAYQRYYTAGLGRFMTPDPKDGSASPYNPQSWNRYSYIQGDPVNGSDPTGIDATCGGSYISQGLTGPSGGQMCSSFSGSSMTAAPSGLSNQSVLLNGFGGEGAAGEAAYAQDVQAIFVANYLIAYAAAQQKQQQQTMELVANAFAALASYLGIGNDASVQVIFQKIGTAISVQALNSNNQAFQLGDLSLNPSADGTTDPSIISLLFHGQGNSSWYFGSDQAFHVVNLVNLSGQDPLFQQGLQWHVDIYNPTSSLGNLLQHFFSEVIPGIGVKSQQAATATCTVNGGCK